MWQIANDSVGNEFLPYISHVNRRAFDSSDNQKDSSSVFEIDFFVNGKTMLDELRFTVNSEKGKRKEIALFFTKTVQNGLRYNFITAISQKMPKFPCL